MVNTAEKRRLLDAYRDPLYPRTAVARALAGLVIITAVSAVGASYSDDGVRTAQVSAQQGASGR